MKTYAVIIHHPFRGNDVRVDLYEVEDDVTAENVKARAEAKMLGPFEVLYVTRKVTKFGVEGGEKNG